MANGPFLLNSKFSWGGGGGGVQFPLAGPHVVTFSQKGGRGRGWGGELMKRDFLYILPQLKGTLYKFRIEQFGDIHCKITIKAMEG